MDGWHHFEQKAQDEKRDQWLKEEGYKVLRFLDHEFYQNREVVLDKIWEECGFSPAPWPPPLKGGVNEANYMINYHNTPLKQF